MGSNLKGTAYERQCLHTSSARTLMQARSVLHFHHNKCSIICPYCTLNKQHTITHVITECEYHTRHQGRIQHQKRNKPEHTNHTPNHVHPGGPLQETISQKYACKSYGRLPYCFPASKRPLPNLLREHIGP